MDFNGPKKIPLRQGYVFGLECLKAKDLVVQQYDSDGNLWASRGMILYKLRKNDNKFVRFDHVPGDLSFIWLLNFAFLRKYFHRFECMEILFSENRGICAFSDGHIWFRSNNSKKFIKTLKLPNYGIGVGRGIMSTGITNFEDGIIFFGEYFDNPQRTYIRIYKSNNYGKSWEIAFEFQPGQIRHIHAVQSDPYTGKLWICTGDEDKESMIGWFESSSKKIIPLGQNSQIWRTCQLVFTEEALFWGTDTGSEDLAGVYRWDKKKMELTKLDKADGAIFFGTELVKGTIVMSTDREGFPIEKDNKTRLIVISTDEKIKIVECGEWDYKKDGNLRSSFAKLRFQRNQGSDALAITCLNQKEVPDGTCIIISEDTLIKSLE